jgi:hypothetical protein
MPCEDLFSLSLNKCSGYSIYRDSHDFQQVLDSSHLVCTDVSLSLWLSYELLTVLICQEPMELLQV